jgi:hypothetical protein
MATAAITGAIGAVLTYLALNPKRQTSVAAAEMSRALRARALAAAAAELGIESAPDETFAVVMDLAYAEAVVSLVCTAFGDASIYFSSGGGIIGGGEHTSVRTAVTSLLRESDNAAGQMLAAHGIDYPFVGNVIFYVRKREALLASSEVSEAALAAGTSLLSQLFFAVQNVITQIRETAPLV